MFTLSFTKIAKSLILPHVAKKFEKHLVGAGKSADKAKRLVQEGKAVGQAHRLDVARQGADPLKTPIQKRLQAVKQDHGSIAKAKKSGASTLHGQQAARPQFANQRTERKLGAVPKSAPAAAAPSPAAAGGSAHAPAPGAKPSGGFAGGFTDRAKSLHQKAVGTWGGMSPGKKMGVAAGAAGVAGIAAGRMSKSDAPQGYGG